MQTSQQHLPAAPIPLPIPLVKLWQKHLSDFMQIFVYFLLCFRSGKHYGYMSTPATRWKNKIKNTYKGSGSNNNYEPKVENFSKLLLPKYRVRMRACWAQKGNCLIFK